MLVDYTTIQVYTDYTGLMLKTVSSKFNPNEATNFSNKCLPENYWLDKIFTEKYHQQKLQNLRHTITWQKVIIS